MTSKCEHDVYFMMLYPSVNFGCNCCIPSKVIVQKPQFCQYLSKKNGHNSVKVLRMTSLFDVDVLSEIGASLKKLLIRNQKYGARTKRRRHNPYASTSLRRRHKKPPAMTIFASSLSAFCKVCSDRTLVRLAFFQGD